MSTLDTLARVARRQAEEVERQLAAAEGRLRMIRERINAHDRALEGERTLAQATTEAALAFGAYAQVALKRRRLIVEEEAALAQEVDALRDVLREAFIELKKIEILIEQEAARAAVEQNRLEQIEMDDVAANMMRRQ